MYAAAARLALHEADRPRARLLPLLSTHLSFPEIAGELFLSLHTIKSQSRSI